MFDKLPHIEKSENVVIEGKNVRRLIFSDNTVGTVTDVIERHLPDGTIQHFMPYESVRKLNHNPDEDYFYSGSKGPGDVWDQYRVERPIEPEKRSCFTGCDECSLVYEKTPDGTVKKYDLYGSLTEVQSPSDHTVTKYNGGSVSYHSTNGVEDTIAYRARRRVEHLKEKKLASLEDKPKIVRKIANKVASSKAFENIALKVAERKIKNGKAY